MFSRVIFAALAFAMFFVSVVRAADAPACAQRE
jgi:hypothetical protein